MLASSRYITSDLDVCYVCIIMVLHISRRCLIINRLEVIHSKTDRCLSLDLSFDEMYYFQAVSRGRPLINMASLEDRAMNGNRLKFICFPHFCSSPDLSTSILFAFPIHYPFSYLTCLLRLVCYFRRLRGHPHHHHDDEDKKVVSSSS